MTHEHHHEHRPPTYVEWIEGQRRANDEAMRSDPHSPLPPESRASFAGVPWFPVDEAWRIDGLALEPYAGDEPELFGMATTDGRIRQAHRAGEFRFSARGVACRLTAYEVARPDGTMVADTLFVPFLDGTTGSETYGAGRYLDVEPDDDGTWTLDFNTAYHPSCVWDPRFSCPMTPPENRLPLRVEAGERLAPGAAH